jgi:hypothetical protein
VATNAIPFQIDYTSRDYLSLRQDLIARVQARVPDWNPNDASDFGVALVEAFAYMGDLMSYYIDRAANESNLTTATRRASVVALANDLGYVPAGYSPATVTVTFTNSSGSSLVIPAGTVVTALIESADSTLEIPFETDSEITVTAGGTTKVTCTQGLTYNGTDGYGVPLDLSSGEPSQYMQLPTGTIVRNSVKVYVNDGVNYYPWTRVDHLADKSSVSRLFSVVDHTQSTFYIKFGDGVSGLIPSIGSGVYVIYNIVDGTVGNVPSGTILNIGRLPGLNSAQIAAINSSMSVFNDAAATGGTDPEDLESIRRNASQVYRTSNRAVTLDDYQNVALAVPSCGKASASSSVPGNVVLTVAPYRSSGSAEDHPGYVYNSGTSTWDEGVELTQLKASVLSAVASKSLVGSTTSVVDPVYDYFVVNLTVAAFSSVRTADALAIVKQAILQRFDYSQAQFGAQVYINDFVALVASLGVSTSVTVDNLYLYGSSVALTDLLAADNALLLLRESDLHITVTGGA